MQTDARGKTLSLAEVAMDLRQCNSADLPSQLEHAIEQVNPNSTENDGRFFSTSTRPYRECLIWDFNKLFWRFLGEWEAVCGARLRGRAADRPVGRQPSGRGQGLGRRVLAAPARPRRARASCRTTSTQWRSASAQVRAPLWLDQFQAFDDARRARSYYHG